MHKPRHIRILLLEKNNTVLFLTSDFVTPTITISGRYRFCRQFELLIK
ncbi:MAG: hypothetical protein PHN75_00250 [Syntrophales bacterium]|nr:hypothetical protein [Syntrophales bacterium]